MNPTVDCTETSVISQYSDCRQRHASGNGLVNFDKEMEIGEGAPHQVLSTSSIPVGRNNIGTATGTNTTTISTASVDDVSHSSAPHSPQYTSVPNDIVKTDK